MFSLSLEKTSKRKSCSHVSLLILAFSEDVSGWGSPVDSRLGESSLLILHVEMVQIGGPPVLRQQVSPGAWSGVGEDGGRSGVVWPAMEQLQVGGRRRRRRRRPGITWSWSDLSDHSVCSHCISWQRSAATACQGRGSFCWTLYHSDSTHCSSHSTPLHPPECWDCVSLLRWCWPASAGPEGWLASVGGGERNYELPWLHSTPGTVCHTGTVALGPHINQHQAWPGGWGGRGPPGGRTIIT